MRLRFKTAAIPMRTNPLRHLLDCRLESIYARHPCDSDSDSRAALKSPEKTLLAGLALTSFAALLLELALTRLFSVVLFYHFAFLAISIALLGLGAGGVCAYLLKTQARGASTRARSPRDCA